MSYERLYLILGKAVLQELGFLPGILLPYSMLTNEERESFEAFVTNFSKPYVS